MKNLIKAIYFLSLLFLFSGCTKEVYLTEEPESIENFPPGEFEVSVEKITDTSVKITWNLPADPENEKVAYDVAVNDSIIAYDLNETRRIISNLIPESTYSISVIAHDSRYNFRKQTVVVKTLKSFIINYYPIDLGYELHDIYASSATADGGFLISGIGTPLELKINEKYNFVAKLNAEFEVEWQKEFEWDLQVKMISLQCTDGNFIAGWTNTLHKLDAGGNVIWTFLCPKSLNIEFISSVTETPAGDFLVTGYSPAFGVKYVVLKISGQGNLVWHKKEGNQKNNRPDYVTLTPNGEILILGTATSFTNGEWRDFYWLLQLDNEGNFLKEKIYPNQFNSEDLVCGLEILPDGNLLFIGSTYGYVGGGLINFIPHLIKTNPDGEILWEIFPEIKSRWDAVFPVVQDYKVMENKNILLYVTDTKGFSFATMNTNGEIIRQWRITGLPRGREIILSPDNKFIFLTNNGVFIFEPEGYLESYPE